MFVYEHVNELLNVKSKVVPVEKVITFNLKCGDNPNCSCKRSHAAVALFLTTKGRWLDPKPRKTLVARVGLFVNSSLQQTVYECMMILGKN